MAVQKIGSLKRSQNVLKRDKKMSFAEDVKFWNDEISKCKSKLKEGKMTEKCVICDSELGDMRICEKCEILHTTNQPSTTKDDLTEMTKIAVKKERDNLINALTLDPIQSDFIVDLIVSRVKEINAILRN